MIVPFKLVGGDCQREVWQPIKQTLDSNFTFETGERRAKAEVDAIPKRYMLVWVTGDVKSIWIRELSRIAIGGDDRAQCHIARFYLTAVPLHGVGCETCK